MAWERGGPALEDFAVTTATSRSRSRPCSPSRSCRTAKGVEPLIKLARTHPDPRVRKKAVFWLGECHDPRALDALIAIIKGK